MKNQRISELAYRDWEKFIEEQDMYPIDQEVKQFLKWLNEDVECPSEVCIRAPNCIHCGGKLMVKRYTKYLVDYIDV